MESLYNGGDNSTSWHVMSLSITSSARNSLHLVESLDKGIPYHRPNTTNYCEDSIVFHNLIIRLLDTTYMIKHHEIKLVSQLEASSLLMRIHRASILCRLLKKKINN